jgi:hypothetical protein
MGKDDKAVIGTNPAKFKKLSLKTLLEFKVKKRLT